MTFPASGRPYSPLPTSGARKGRPYGMIVPYDANR